MKIALLTDGIHPYVVGGMQKHSFNLCKFLMLRGHEITLVHCMPSHAATVPGKQEIAEVMGLQDASLLTTVGLRFPAPGNNPGHYLKESYTYSKNIYQKLFSEWKTFDVILAKGFSAWHLLREKSRGAPLPPVVVNFHGFEMFQPPPNLRSRFASWLLKSPVRWNVRKADYVFSYGGKITTIIQSLGVPDEKILEIPTGIDSGWLRQGRIHPVGEVRQFVYVGRYERRKGIEELNLVLNRIKDKESFKFHFVGPLPATRRIRHENFIYHGEVKDKNQLTAILDPCEVLVTPSHSEGMPNVIAEGMARGLAVVATDVGAISALVNEQNGWLIPPGDEQALESALLAAIHLSPALLDVRRSISMTRIREFSWENIARITEEKLAGILGPNRH